MKLSCITLTAVSVAMSLLPGFSAAAPVESGDVIKRNGPEGRIQSYTNRIRKGESLQIEYTPVQRVAPSSGQVTNALIVNLRQGNTIVPLGSSGLDKDVDEVLISYDTIQQRQGLKCGDWAVEITEQQTGPVYTGTFLAYSPTVTIYGC